MNDNSQYKIFLSYSHKDAELYGSAAIDKIKSDIEADLRTYAGDALVFLDTNALKLGDEWHVKITHVLNQCNVFICLLSPNYLKSPYCTRERHLWAQKEIAQGRFHKETLPIYYIELDDDLFSGEQPDKVKELRSLQMNAVPWITGKSNGVPEDIIAERLMPLKEAIRDRFKRLWKANESFSSVIPRLSPFFSGRLKELKELRELCFDKNEPFRKFPVISAAGGTGKTELAIAYSYAYAEDYPQGRFLIRMEGQKDWQSAINSMLYEYGLDGQLVKDQLGISEDEIKQSAGNPEKLHRLIMTALLNRARQGAMLLLLDNVEYLSLFRRNVMERQFALNMPLPDNLQIIATTRNSEKINATDRCCIYELPNLNADEAFELLCQIGGEDFLFNQKVPDENDPEYCAALEIIKLLDGHAWSLEITGGQIANGYIDGSTSFAAKLLELQKTFDISSDIGIGHHQAQTQEELLKPSLDIISALDNGDEILTLATICTFFPADQIDLGAIKDFCTKHYPVQAGYSQDFFAAAQEQLERFHLIRSEKTQAKMHRITAAVLQKRAGENNLFRWMKTFVDVLPDYSQLLFDHYSFIRGLNVTRTAVDLYSKLKEKDMCRTEELLNGKIMHGKMLFRSCKFSDSLTIFQDVLASLENSNQTSSVDFRPLRAKTLYWTAQLYFACRQYSEAADRANLCYELSTTLAEENPQQYLQFTIQALNLIGQLIKTKSYDEADVFFSKADDLCNSYETCFGTLDESIRIDTKLNIYELAIDKKDIDKYISGAGREILNSIQIYGKKSIEDFDAYAPIAIRFIEIEAQFRLLINDYGQCDFYLSQGICFRNVLSKREPDANMPQLAFCYLLRSQANLHRGENISKTYMLSAASDAEKAAKLFRRLAEKNPDVYNEKYATALYLHGTALCQQNDLAQAEDLLMQAMNIFLSLPSGAFCMFQYLCVSSLAVLLKKKGDFQNAEKCFETAVNGMLSLPEKSQKDYICEVIKICFEWGELYENAALYKEAIAKYHQALSYCSQLKNIAVTVLHLIPVISKVSQRASDFCNSTGVSKEECDCFKEKITDCLTEFRMRLSDHGVLAPLLSPVNISRGVIALLDSVLPEINALIARYYPEQKLEVFDSLQETVPKPQYVCLEIEPECISFLSTIRLMLTIKQNVPVPDPLIQEAAKLLQQHLTSFDNVLWPVPEEYTCMPDGKKLPISGAGICDKKIQFDSLSDQTVKVAIFSLTECKFTN